MINVEGKEHGSHYAVAIDDAYLRVANAIFISCAVLHIPSNIDQSLVMLKHHFGQHI